MVSLISLQVFSSWLNMVGCTVREALALTIGRALIEDTDHGQIRIHVEGLFISPNTAEWKRTCKALLYLPQKHQQSDLQHGKAS